MCRAARLRKVEIVAYLVTLKCENDALGDALVEACEGGSLQSMKLLLDAGADPQYLGNEPIKVSCSKGSQ